MRAVHLVLVVAIFLAPGCGGTPAMVPVKGVVKLAGKPLAHCKVGLFPDVEGFDPTKHGYGFGMTNAKGEFEIQHPNGTKGIWPGTYKVTFVAWIDSKGKPVPPEMKPSEIPGGVKNLLHDKYETLSDTPERLTVTKEAAEVTFDLPAR